MQENLVQPITRADNAQAVKNGLKISSIKPSSLYNLSDSERAKGYYFLFEGLEVPFRVLFQDNDKTHGILGISFISARDCPSKALGLCQLPNDKLCYACSGECRATRRENENGDKGMDSYLNSCLCSYFWDLWKESPQVRRDLFNYLDDKGIHTLRFNLKGDFRDFEDCHIIWHFAEYGYKLTGYTARDDLATTLYDLAFHPNIILNGSNREYTNRFKVTCDLLEWVQAPLKCLGSCADCLKCYQLRDKEIICLVHGNGSETELNNPNNQELINYIFNAWGLQTLAPEEFRKAKGLITCINKALAVRGESLAFDSSKDFIRFVNNEVIEL